MIPESHREEGYGVYHASTTPYNIEKGVKVFKVIEPRYSDETHLIYGKCPYCKTEAQRVWNLNYCGYCGGKISWHDISVKNYGDIQ